MIDRDAIEQFKEIWREENGETLSDGIAMVEAVNLLTLIDKIYRRMPQRWMDDVIAKESKNKS